MISLQGLLNIFNLNMYQIYTPGFIVFNSFITNNLTGKIATEEDALPYDAMMLVSDWNICMDKVTRDDFKLVEEQLNKIVIAIVNKVHYMLILDSVIIQCPGKYLIRSSIQVKEIDI